MNKNKNINILYYNTNIQNKDIILKACLSININILFANSIQFFYETISIHNIDIIFIDYEGEEEIVKMIYSIHKHNLNLIIYIFSSISCEYEQIKMYSLGATQYLILPINDNILKLHIQNIIQLINSRQILQNKVENKTNIIKERELETLLILSRISEYKDKDTANHSLRVGKYSALLMEKIGGSKEEQDIILYSAPLHDVGKISIPDNILNKTSSLTKEEYEIMKTHTVKGYNMLSFTKNKYLEAGAIIALSHHEKYDGTGYPKSLHGENIHLYGRIVAIADVFDALISERVYKNSWTLEDTIDYIKSQAGSHFDPQLTKIFLANIHKAEEIINTIPPKL